MLPLRSGLQPPLFRTRDPVTLAAACSKENTADLGAAAAKTCENVFVKFTIPAALFLALAAHGSAQAPDLQAAAQAGAAVFQSNCARCHGADLEGGKKAPALAEIRKKKHWTDDRITYRILNGAGKMPAFRETLSDEQIRDLIAYLRAENRPAPPPAPAASADKK